MTVEDVKLPKASELKRGDVVDLDGTPHIVRQIESRSPSSRGAATLYKVRLDNLLSGQKRDESLKGDELLQAADCQRVEVQFSYIDGDHYVFMDSADYSQYMLDSEILKDQLAYLHDGLEGIVALVIEGSIAAIELPHSVELPIVDTAPGIKGASASARTKPATLTTGHVVQVPEYIEPGEVVKVNTQNGKYMARA